MSESKGLKIIKAQKEYFSKGETISYEWRVKQLKALENLLTENKKLVN
jgi:hypothetical protein